MIKIAFHPIYKLPLPDGHRFPMLKYELIAEQLLYEGTFSEINFFEPEVVDLKDVLRVHTQQYLNDLLNLRLSQKMIRKIGFPLTKELVYREKIITQGTIDCCGFAITNGIAFNVAGGTHHAYSDSGEGFCLLNDVAVAATKLLDEGKVKKIFLIDLDVHQGNGTAKIFENESKVFTFSMHGKDNYPLNKEQSDFDIELVTGMEGDFYLDLLYSDLPKLIKKYDPDFLFYISGVDVLKTDKLGKLGLSKEDCKQRDRFVFELAKKLNLPITVVMGGGYSPNIIDIVDAHCTTFRVANELY